MNFDEIKALAITLTRKLELDPFSYMNDNDAIKNKKIWEYLEPIAITMIQNKESTRTYSKPKYMLEF